MSHPRIHNFINNEIVPTFKYSDKLNPYTLELHNQISNSEPMDLIKAIQPAQKAFQEWRQSSIENRAELLQSFKTLFAQKKNELIVATATDLALPIFFVEKADAVVGMDICTDLETQLQKQKLNSDSQWQYSAVGPMGFVLSSNFPFRLFCQNVLPALLAGNSVIIKFSSTSSDFAKVFIEILSEMASMQKWPVGLVQVVSGKDTQFKNLFVTHPGIKGLAVTGSADTLQKIHQQISTVFPQQYKKIKLLGGSKNLSVVLSDVEEETADQIFDSFMLGQGQLHWNSARLFVLEKNVKSWTDYLQTKLNMLKPSQSIEDGSSWTPVFKTFAKYSEIYQLAKSDQAKLLTSGEPADFIRINSKIKPANYLRPIFTQDMSNCSTLQQDQVHAPLFILSSIKYPFDVPKYANVSYYGDTANIWCESGKGQKVIAELDVANISMNAWSIYSKSQHAGVKQSSYGMTDPRIFGAFYSNVKNLT